MFPRRLLILAAALVALPSALAQSNQNSLGDLVQALQNLGLTQLASITQAINGTNVGQEILGNLSTGNPYLVFAPNNNALSRVPQSVTGDVTALADIIAYHILPGNFSGPASKSPNVTLGRTLLADPSLVRLEGENRAQALAWTARNNGTVQVLNQQQPTSVVNSTTVGNFTVLVVDHVLQIPVNFSEVARDNNGTLSSVEAILRTVQTPVYDTSTNTTTNVTIFDALDTHWEGYTFFAPSNDAVGSVQGDLQSLNASVVQTLIYNHILNGTTIYTPLLVGKNFTTTAGERLSVSINSTGQYVTDVSTNVTAKIIQPDMLVSNGVVHLIDRVFKNTASDSQAANNALSSATSAATASQPSQTAPIGFAETSGLANGPSATQSAGGSSDAMGSPLNLGYMWSAIVWAGALLGGMAVVV